MTAGFLPPPPVDLASLLGEMAALKSEVRAETRSSRDLREELSRSSEQLAAELARASTREQQLRAEVAGAKEAARRHEVNRLIGLLDRVEALERAAKTAPPRGLWRRRPDPALQALAEGLSLMVDRFGEVLDSLGVRRIRTTGALMDPHCMEAVETVSDSERPALTVVEEIASGWLDADRVVRPAKVVVISPRGVEEGA